MPILSSLTSLFSRFAGSSPRKDSLDRLPNDILLDGIMSYLDVVDIIRLRQASKLYYELTHHGALWKRLLRTADIPLPPLPPTSRHTPKHMTGLEAERIMCRAYSLNRNWNSTRPRCLHEWFFPAYHRVLEMTLLPGGRYLVASVCDSHAQRYSLIVYAIDTFGRSRPIAKTETTTKAYSIRAKYVTLKGRKSVAIAYLRREYHHKRDKRRAERGELPDVSEYSTYHELDPEIGLRYECVAIHARLSDLEMLTDMSYDTGPEEFMEAASRLAPPFENLVCVRSRPEHPLMCPDIEEMFDSAYLAVVKCPGDVVFKRLDGGPSATLTCLPVVIHAESKHTIKAIRLLPQESSVFVVREIATPRTPEQRCPIYAFETYTAIPAGPNKTSIANDADACMLAHDIGTLAQVYVADPNTPPRDDSSIVGILRNSASRVEPPPPPPICVYGRRVDDEGFVVVRFFAERYVLEFPPTPPSAGSIIQTPPRPARREVVYRYPLSYNDLFEKESHLNEHNRIIPGVVRPLLCYYPWDDITDAPPVLEVRPFIDRGMLRPMFVENRVAVPELGMRRLASFEPPWPWQGKRAVAFAWDETIGRLVMAEPDTDELCVYEFAHAPRQGPDRRRLPLPLKEIPNPDLLPHVMHEAEKMDML
ncbi:hypothetical protein C8Q79DRAFT_989779 [Trametes meyenii]|nr:hypothetical protein C8Q79DRAFT_989779 [Trametes meyenii]